MSFPPWWAGALAIAAIPIASWLLLGQVLAVSGRVTRLVDWARRPPPPAEPPPSDEALLAELAALTAEEFGLDPATLDPIPLPPAPIAPAPATGIPSRHLAFFGGLAIGGAALAAATGRFHPALAIAGTGFSRLAGPGLPGQVALLVAGGFLVGLGTRMSGGCTSGHGLCGVSRLQPGSLVSTASFLGAAVAASLAMELVR